MTFVFIPFDFNSTFIEIGIRFSNAKIRNEPCNDFAAKLKFLCLKVHFTKMELPRMLPCIFWKNATSF